MINEKQQKEILRRIEVVASKLKIQIHKLKAAEIRGDIEWITDYGELLKNPSHEE